MFSFNPKTMALTLHQGDTGSINIGGRLRNGDSWTSDDIMRFTVASGNGEIVMDRAYKMSGVDGVPEGCAVVEFHSNDTGAWGAGTYAMQIRFYVNPSWSGSAPSGGVTDLLDVDNYPVEGDLVRIPEAGDETPAGIGTITILRAYGEG